MKLRSRFPLLQLISVAGCIVAFSWLAPLSAQAQHRVTLTSGQSQTVTVIGVSQGNLQVQAGSAVVPVPLSKVASVDMPAPPEFAVAKAAMQAKDYGKALLAARAISDKFKGLPSDWAREATVMVGDIYLALGDENRATAAYADYEKAYPGKSTVQGDLGLARLALAKKDFDGAEAKLKGVLSKADEKLVPAPELAVPLSQATYLSGQIKEAKGDKQGALEDYLRTVTVFYADRASADGAQEKADALRKKEKVVVP